MPSSRCRFLITFVCALAVSGVALAGELLVDAGRGPVVVHIPSNYDESHFFPLVLSLHGYTNTGPGQEAYFQLLPLAEQEAFLYAYPTGTTDAIGNPFWNATDACCDLFNSGVDDSTYLLGLIRAIRGELNVDPWRVHFVGHSNGGFMSYRMACDHADVVASIGSLAGATYFDPAECTPATSVHVLQIHGTNDGVILYNGGDIGGTAYPGAVQTSETWAGYDGCSLVPDSSAPPRDLDVGIAGAESTVSAYDADCALTGSAELWTIQGGSHSPQLSTGFRDGLVDFVLGHRKAGMEFTDKQTLRWSPLDWAASYRVYRGELAELVDALPENGYGECASGSDPDPTDTMLVVTDVPRSGTGYFYLAGFVDEHGVASMLGTTSQGVARWPGVDCP